MLRETIVTLALASVAGCAASTSIKPVGMNDKNSETAQLAAYAATAELPKDVQPKDNLRAAAIVDRQDNSIRIYNFTDKPLNAGNIWINHAYVQRLETVPAHGSVTLSRSHFYDHTGRSLAKTDIPVNNVQIQWDNDVYNLMGPVYEQR